MTAGVQQSIEPAAYLPTPSSNPSADAKRAADDPGASASSDPEDFQAELKLHEDDAQPDLDTKAPKTLFVRAEQASNRPEKKCDSQENDLNQIAAAVVVPENPDPKQLLARVVSIPAESAPADAPIPSSAVGNSIELKDSAETAISLEIRANSEPFSEPFPPQLSAQGSEQAEKTAAVSPQLSDPLAPEVQPELARPASRATTFPQASPDANLQPGASQAPEKRERPDRPAAPPSLQLPQAMQKETKSKKAAAPATVQAAPDLAALTPLVAAQAPAQQPASSQNQRLETQQSAGNEMPVAGNPPAPRADFSVPAAPQEPAASAIHEALDPVASPPAALAFAARLLPTAQKTGDSAADSSAPVRSVPNPPALARIPMRYAPTAQILPASDDSDSQIDRTFRVPEIRTDLVISRPDTSHQAAATPDTLPRPEAVPIARAERVIEPLAAAPSSPHDIRVRVPDSNGGATQVRFFESGGEVKVSVRTDDPALAQSLRTHLNDLTQRLTDSGIPTEIWRPASNPASSQSGQQSPDREGRGSDGQQPGGHGGQHRQEGDRRPAWLEEMEASLHAQA